MKTKLGIAIGSAMGVALYDAIRHGVAGIEWTKVVAVPLIIFVLLLLVPNRWLERKKGTGS